MPQIIIANWKMNSPPLADWVTKVAPAAESEKVEVIVCPPFTQLAAATMLVARTQMYLGAQDCHAEESGAYTGDISATMLAMSGCTHVILGHSERRQYHGENDVQVKAKAEGALAKDLTPIICIGETLEQYEAGETLAVLARQMRDAVPLIKDDSSEIIIAYEPVWAIGSGRTPTTEEISVAHQHIKKQLEKPWAIVYGGSVKPANANEILATDGVNGLLVGGASLKPKDFLAIMQAAK